VHRCESSQSVIIGAGFFTLGPDGVEFFAKMAEEGPATRHSSNREGFTRITIGIQMTPMSDYGTRIYGDGVLERPSKNTTEW
jgi:hypothetical protein